MRMFRQTRDQVENVPCKSLLSSQQPISNRSKRELRSGGGGGGKGEGKYHSTAFLTKRHCRSMTYQQHIGWKSSKGSVILNYTEATFLRYQERMTFHLFYLSPTWILCAPRCIHLWRKYIWQPSSSSLSSWPLITQPLYYCITNMWVYFNLQLSTDKGQCCVSMGNFLKSIGQAALMVILKIIEPRR